MSATTASDAESLSKTPQHGAPREIVVDESPQTKRPWLTLALFQFFCLLWLVPILFMLVKNFQGWIIGASAWCPGGQCWADIFDFSLGNVWQTAHKLDVQSHDLVGALQFVAKALEVWFIIITTSFVYLYTMWLAERAEGLPLRYLSWPSEFSDITSIFSRSLWTTAYSTQNKNERQLWPLPFFVTFTVFLAVLCALMGPSVAVLIIPSLQWVPTTPVGNQVFNEIASSSPPNANALHDTINLQYNKSLVQQWCTESELANGRYSCTADTLGVTLDSLVSQYLDFYNSGVQDSNFGLVQQSGVASIMWNASDLRAFSKSALWTPNRQVLHQIGRARNIIFLASQNWENGLLAEALPSYDDYRVFNRSLEMRVQRNGPMIGARPNFWVPGNNAAWTTYIDSDRSIRCYPDYSIVYFGQPGTPYTKCVRVGTGWNAANKQVNFTIAGVNDGSGNNESDTKVSLSFSDKATYLRDNQLPSWLSAACLSNRNNGVVPSNATCDWDRLFSLDAGGLANRTENLNTWDFFLPDDTSTPFMMADFVAYIGFSLYQLDPSPAVNPLALVQTLEVPDTGQALVIDPAWAALTFSVDTSGGVLLANRTSAIQFSYGIEEYQTRANLVLWFAIFNMLTHFPYSTVSAGNAEVDEQHPLIQLTGSVYVYAYRINSRTSVFSIVVVIIGVVVVLLHFLLRLWYYRPQKSIKEVIISALEHPPQGEFDGLNSGQEAVKTRFKVEHSQQSIGELIFRRQH